MVGDKLTGALELQPVYARVRKLTIADAEASPHDLRALRKHERVLLPNVDQLAPWWAR
jgi:hypothetical protein